MYSLPPVLCPEHGGAGKYMARAAPARTACLSIQVSSNHIPPTKGPIHEYDWTAKKIRNKLYKIQYMGPTRHHPSSSHSLLLSLVLTQPAYKIKHLTYTLINHHHHHKYSISFIHSKR